jgi:hypothetical protein
MPAACRPPPCFRFPLNNVLTRSPGILIVPHLFNFLRPLLLAVTLVAAVLPAAATTSGIASTGDPVTVKDNGDGTVTMANGIVSILLEDAEIRSAALLNTSLQEVQLCTVP